MQTQAPPRRIRCRADAPPVSSPCGLSCARTNIPEPSSHLGFQVRHHLHLDTRRAHSYPLPTKTWSRPLKSGVKWERVRRRWLGWNWNRNRRNRKRIPRRRGKPHRDHLSSSRPIMQHPLRQAVVSLRGRCNLPRARPRPHCRLCGFAVPHISSRHASINKASRRPAGQRAASACRCFTSHHVELLQGRGSSRVAPCRIAASIASDDTTQDNAAASPPCRTRSWASPSWPPSTP